MIQNSQNPLQRANGDQMQKRQEPLLQQPNQLQKLNQSKQVLAQNKAHQRLCVNVLDKNSLQNPEFYNAQGFTNFNQSNSPYGPFGQFQEGQKMAYKGANLNQTGQINISPVLYGSQNHNKQKINKFMNTKGKKTSKILTQQSSHEISPKIDQSELQKQILQLAKNIRQKVKKTQLHKGHTLQNQLVNHIFSPSLLVERPNTLERRELDPKIKHVYNKRQSLFQKYSYPRSINVDLKELQMQQQRLKIGKYKMSNTFKEEDIEESLQNVQMQIKIRQIKKRSHSGTEGPENKGKQQMLPKLKLSFDSTHHKYRVTQFRKSILKERKDRQTAKQIVVKQKEQALQKRRHIYNNSRYHPVGIKLSSLRLTKVQQKLDERSSIGGTFDFKNIGEQTISFTNLASPQTNNQENGLKSERLDFDSEQNGQSKINDASQVKSSLTFNFSFSDQRNNMNSEIKTQSQIYNELSNLTKGMENDSTPEQKIHKLSQNDKVSKLGTQSNRNQATVKKWSNMQNQLTQSKTMDEIQRLHNASDHSEEQNQQKLTDLQYSNF